jgi:hypothetical protein
MGFQFRAGDSSPQVHKGGQALVAESGLAQPPECQALFSHPVQLQLLPFVLGGD